MTNTPKDLDQTQSPANEAGKELKPCPVPWGNNPTPRIAPVVNGYRVRCDVCGASGSFERAPAEAIANWNTRPEDLCFAELKDEYDRRNRSLLDEVTALKTELEVANEAAQFYNRKAADAIVLR
jgi:hypothetical protein